MRYMIDTESRVIFIWNAKCGCTFLKKLFFAYLGFENYARKNVHKLNRTKWLMSPLPPDHEKYKIFLFCRNPYNRLVSGFLNKFVTDVPNYISKRIENIDEFSFEDYVDFLEKNQNTELVDEHHFGKQIDMVEMKKMKVNFIFDIENIDRKVLDEHFKKNSDLFQCTKINWNSTKKSNKKIPHIFQMKTKALKKMMVFPDYSSFYNNKLKNKVRTIYETDFKYFEQHGFQYTI